MTSTNNPHDDGPANRRAAAEELAPEVLRAYLAEEISLGRAAELLGLSRFDAQERFRRLGIPLLLGPATLEEARAEVASAMRADE